jgi:hypothetical protein
LKRDEGEYVQWEVYLWGWDGFNEEGGQGKVEEMALVWGRGDRTD